MREMLVSRSASGVDFCQCREGIRRETALALQICRKKRSAILSEHDRRRHAGKVALAKRRLAIVMHCPENEVERRWPNVPYSASEMRMLTLSFGASPYIEHQKRLHK